MTLGCRSTSEIIVDVPCHHSTIVALCSDQDRIVVNDAFVRCGLCMGVHTHVTRTIPCIYVDDRVRV